VAATFDTLEYVNQLKAADVPEAQAQVQAKALRDVLDMALAEQDKAAQQASERAASALDTKTEQSVSKLEKATLKLENDIALVRKDIDNLRWMVGAVLGGIIALLVRTFF